MKELPTNMRSTKIAKTILGAVLAAVALNAHARDLPDQQMTPGARNSAVTQENIYETICVRGYTKTIRPPAYYTNTLKRQQMAEYAYVDRNPRHYEEDHLIPLEIGGAPTDPRNLWPEPRYSGWSAERKDELENALHRLVCDGRVPLVVAQHAIASDWIEAYKQYVR
jgi:hypothetical protein